MKILYVGNFFFPRGNAAGNRVLGNGYLFREIGYQVDFLGLDKKVAPNTPLLETKKTYDGFDFYTFPYPKNYLDWLLFGGVLKDAINLIKLTAPKIVIMYGSPRLSLFCLALIVYCKIKKITIVSDCVDWMESHSGSNFYRFIKWIDIQLQKRVINFLVDGVIVISSFLDNFYRGKKILRLPPLVNNTYYKELVPNYLYNKKKQLTYVGNPFPVGQKTSSAVGAKDRIDLLIDLLILIKHIDCQLNIAGLSELEFIKNYPNYSEKIKELGGKLIFHGFLDNESAIRLIANSDFTVLLRDDNRMTRAGFPTKIVESVSCGTPVITNRTSDIPTFIQDGVNGFLVEIENFSSFSSSVEEILKISKERLCQMKINCLNSHLFGYENYQIQAAKYFDNLVKRDLA